MIFVSKFDFVILADKLTIFIFNDLLNNFRSVNRISFLQRRYKWSPFEFKNHEIG
jgi:hypothetical protein